MAGSHGYLQEKIENTPGNETNSPTYGTKIMYPVLQSFTPTPGTNPMERDDELRNSEEPLSVIPEHYEPAWAMTGRIYPDLLGWRLTHIFGPPTTTVGDGVITDPDAATIPAGAFRHVWKSTDGSWGGTGMTPPTRQMYAAYKDQGVYMKLKGCGCDSLALNAQPTGGLTLDASGPALYLDDGAADPAATPAYESAAIRPFEYAGLTLPTFLASSGTHDDFGVAISAPVDRVFSMGGSSKWADIMEKGDGLITVSGSVSTRQLTAADIAAVRASTGFAVKAKWLSDTIATGSYKHAAWMEGVNAQYTASTIPALANVRHMGASFNWKLTTAGSGVACTFTVVSTTAAYT